MPLPTVMTSSMPLGHAAQANGRQSYDTSTEQPGVARHVALACSSEPNDVEPPHRWKKAALSTRGPSTNFGPNSMVVVSVGIVLVMVHVPPPPDACNNSSVVL